MFEGWFSALVMALLRSLRNDERTAAVSHINARDADC